MQRSLLEANLDRVRGRIERAARRAGRDPSGVRLVAVTKSVAPEVALELARLGATDLGESRVDALEAKRAAFEEAGVRATWHFIGHVQRNKARRVVRLADAIHSVDSLALLDALERVAGEEGRRPEVFLEVELSPEGTKQGFAPDALPEAARRARAARHLCLRGLMTMAPAPDAAAGAGPGAVFARLARLGAGLEAGGGDARLELSMGMSGDFEDAIEAGSDVVRVGSALFEGQDARADRQAEVGG